MRKLLLAIIIAMAILPNAFGQNVGIGTTSPQSKLHINGEARADNLLLFSDSLSTKAIDVIGILPEAIDQQNNSLFNSGYGFGPTVTAWQSFTANVTGLLTKVSLPFGYANGGSSRTLRIYAGTGVGGQLLKTLPFDITVSQFVFQESLPINLPIAKDSIYTIFLTDYNGWVNNQFNPYPRGISSIGSNFDWKFITYATAIDTTFSVSKLGKTITSNLQISNGAGTNKILTSDAFGNASWNNPQTVNPTYWTSTSNNIYSNNSGSVGIGTNIPSAKLNVESTSNNVLNISGPNSQLRIVENDNANKQWKFEVNNSNFSITEDAVAVPLLLKAGSDNSVIVTTNDTVQIKKLQVGTNGTAIAKMQAGTFAIGSQPLPQATKEVTFTFTTAFTNTPKIIATCRNEVSTYTDQYVATVKTVSATSVTFIIRRLDSGAGWGQNVQLDWWGFE
jgi:hypothetical protein